MHCDRLWHSFSPKFYSKILGVLGCSEEELIEIFMLTLKEF